MIYVRDSIEKELNLPSGDREIPLIIQDKKAIDTSLEYSVNQHEVIWGLMGDFVCINGVHQPFHSAGTSTYRLRILNGSNARTYDLGFSNDLPFHLIGSDCGLLEQSHALNALTIGPAERADILVDFSKQNINTTVFLIDKNNYDRKLMKFVIEKEHNDNFEIPNQLSTIDKLNPESASKTRRFTLSDHGMMGRNQVHEINGKSYDKYRIDEVVKSNTTEVWEFDNTNGVVDHPMHLHGVQFQILERIGGRNQLTPSETSYKDTFLVRAGEKVKIIIPFGSDKGKYVFHCHNLEHENNGMML